MNVTRRIPWHLHGFVPGRDFSPVVDPGTLGPVDLAQYEMAVYNYTMETADLSFGSHNALYSRALLAETESFFGITPWLRAPEGGPLPDEGSPVEATQETNEPGTTQVEVRP